MQIEVQSTTKPACANGSVSSLELASAIHVKLVDNQTALNIRDANMECENGLADRVWPTTMPMGRGVCVRTAAVAPNRTRAAASVRRQLTVVM